ncbi:hypothetical protein, partial [Komagataeibacter melaceti]|uniref:hypothetical protein n=1 Tax=Komagataeibacter melaceti TaxID=2766577 RepID=UPI0019D4739C
MIPDFETVRRIITSATHPPATLEFFYEQFHLWAQNAKRPLTRPFKVMILLDLVAGAGFEPAAF